MTISSAMYACALMSPTEQASRANAKIARVAATVTTKPRPKRTEAGEDRHATNAPEIAARRGRARIRAAAASEPAANTDRGIRRGPMNQIPTAHQAADPTQPTAASSTGSARVHSSRRTRAKPGRM